MSFSHYILLPFSLCLCNHCTYSDPVKRPPTALLIAVREMEKKTESLFLPDIYWQFWPISYIKLSKVTMTFIEALLLTNKSWQEFLMLFYSSCWKPNCVYSIVPHSRVSWDGPGSRSLSSIINRPQIPYCFVFMWLIPSF